MKFSIYFFGKSYTIVINSYILLLPVKEATYFIKTANSSTKIKDYKAYGASKKRAIAHYFRNTGSKLENTKNI